MKFCPHCGSDVGENDRFRRVCGYQLISNEEETMKDNPPVTQETHSRISHHGCC